MDWITLLIEIVGVVIVIAFIIIPLQEFAQIFRTVKHKPKMSDSVGSADERRPA